MEHNQERPADGMSGSTIEETELDRHFYLTVICIASELTLVDGINVVALKELSQAEEDLTGAHLPALLD